jgi:hypothetical protein
MQNILKTMLDKFLGKLCHFNATTIQTEKNIVDDEGVMIVRAFKKEKDYVAKKFIKELEHREEAIAKNWWTGGYRFVGLQNGKQVPALIVDLYQTNELEWGAIVLIDKKTYAIPLRFVEIID